ncbi:TonB-dependent receptor [Alloacidobacterium dinghuense]|uniref:TonB-dependent receptor n=1 Tax=Alloacidobacterium dinghuense TaxID=2763107 RepID=A0A7G8BJ37_9BACT|nr:TonB-dependent receptor [Alloacidobacterium dinghuense]QNI32557.1 TonB-dependent receptor [Alloacidobacterium dinghuense]
MRSIQLFTRALLLAITTCVLVFPAGPAVAQVDRAGLDGTITDPSGKVIPGVHVVAEMPDTGLKRETVSSPTGSYDIPELPVGTYTITFDHPGFKTLTFVDVKQVIGRTRTLDATLQVAGGEEHLQVSASSEQMDDSTDALGGRIDKVQADKLPINGRNWATLTALAPGAVDTGGSNQRSIRFAGRGRDDDNFTYDGVDATNIVNQPQQPYVRLSIPLDAIEEFRIDSMLTTAEGGATGGPQLAVTSPSGTNQWHGNAFEYLRNNVFDAQQPVPASTSQPPFHLNQFGGALSGPIVRDKTFFFLAYEGYRQRWGFPLLGYVPSSAFRTQVLADSPELEPIVNAYPLGTAPTSDPNIDQFSSEGTQAVNENSAMIRLDQRFTEKTTAYVRFNYDRAVNTQPLASSGNYLEDLQQLTSTPVNGAIELLHIFNPNLVEEFKFGYNRGTADTDDLNHTGIPYAVSVSGFTTLNNNRFSTGVGNSFSWIDNLTWIKSRHTVKAGVEIRRIQLNQGNTEAGTITYASTTAFDKNSVSSATLNGALPINGLRKTQYYGYVQDEFKWTPNFTVNLGARYSFFNIFHEVQGRANPFDFATCGPQGFCGVGASFGRPNYGDIDPRVAFAWAPENNGKTLIRAGFGMYHEDGQLDDQNLPISNEVFAYSLSNKTIPNLSYPIDPFLANTTGIVSPRAQDRQRKDTYVEQWGLSVQRELPGDFVGTVSYVGSHGVYLLTLSEVNVVDAATGVRPYPAFSQVSWRGTKDASSYQGFSVAVKRSFSRGLLFSANYMWSHEIDDGSDGSGDGDSLVPQNVACPQCERASGIWDVRHVVNANAIYQLPFGPGRSYLNQAGILSSIARDWEVTSVALARTGFPVNVLVNRSSASVPDGNSTDQRPDLVPGVTVTPTGGKSIGEWINPAAFALPAAGTFGDAPRNIVRGPGAWQIDFGVAKTISLGERARLEFRSEFFNIFNHPQYGLPNATFAVPGFGSITQTVNTTTPVSPIGSGTPREIQFALRFAF